MDINGGIWSFAKHNRDLEMVHPWKMNIHGTQSHAGLLQMIFPMSIPDDFKVNRLLMFTWNPKEPFINVCFNWMMNQIIT